MARESFDYLLDLVDSQPLGSWDDVVRDVISAMGARSTKFLATATGKDMRSAERWVAKATNKINPRTGRLSQASTPKASAAAQIARAWQLKQAADKMRNMTTIKAGTVSVAYNGTPAGNRNIGDLGPGAPQVLDHIAAAAQSVEEGDLEGAVDLLDQGVMRGYEADMITPESYVDGFSLE